MKNLKKQKINIYSYFKLFNLYITNYDNNKKFSLKKNYQQNLIQRVKNKYKNILIKFIKNII